MRPTLCDKGDGGEQFPHSAGIISYVLYIRIVGEDTSHPHSAYDMILYAMSVSDMIPRVYVYRRGYVVQTAWVHAAGLHSQSGHRGAIV